MFVRINQKNDLLDVPDNFVALKHIDAEGNLHLELTYLFHQRRILKEGALIVRALLYAEIVKPQKLTDASVLKTVTPTQLVKNALTLIPSTKSAIKANETLILAQKRSDLTAKVNNELIHALKNDLIPDDQIVSFTKRKLILRNKSEIHDKSLVVPVLHRVVEHNELTKHEEREIRHLIHECIIKHGVDPSNVVEIGKHNALTAKAAFHGRNRVKPPAESKSHILLQKIADKLLSNPDRDKHTSRDLKLHDPIHVVEHVSSDEVEHKIMLVVPKARLNQANSENTHIFVKFELLKANNLPLQVVTKKINLRKHINVFNTPTRAPSVKHSRVGLQNNVNLHITQRDHSARAIRIFKKIIKKSSSVVSPYEFVGEFELTRDQAFRNVALKIAPVGVTIFRVVSVGPTGIVSPTFTNVVVTPAVRKRQVFASIVPKIVSSGIEITVRELPTDVVSVRVLRRDETLNQADYNIVDPLESVRVTHDNPVYTVPDVTVKPGHVYSYVCDLVYRDGEVIRFGNAVIEYLPLVENVVNISIENLKSTSNERGHNVVFNIKTRIIESDFDILKRMLEKQNILGFFNNEILKERDKLQQLLAHHVVRINLTTGQIENFGVIVDDEFSDEKNRITNGVSDLELGKKYRYVISTFLRSPETMFEDFEKTVVDSVSRKSFTFKPAKYLHPIALKYGNISNKITQRAYHSKNQMAFGAIGNSVSIDVSFENSNVRVNDAQAEQFDNYTNLVTWRLLGDNDLIDHFLVIAEHMGIRTMVDKVHSNEGKRAYTFIHHHRDSDIIGEVKYIIVPVFSNYSIGSEVQAKVITI